MKTGFALSTLMSGVVFALLVLSMSSCGRSMVVDPQGRLVEPGPDTPGRTKATYTWESHLHPFESLRTRVIPGDQLEYEETSWSLPYVARLQKRKLVVTRDGRELLVARDGDVLFWTTMTGVSLIPLAVWSVIAAWVATVAPRRQKLGSP